MSFLAPLYALGVLSVVGPILFHLVRNRPRQQSPFSSLLFLQPSPPRVARRSRLDDWILLLLRCLVLTLLAIAFTRPFFRSADETMAAPPGRHVIVLLDTSGSMRREDLWDQAVGEFQRLVDQLGDADHVSLLTFDREVTQVGSTLQSQPDLLESGSTQSGLAPDPETLRADMLARVRQLKPTWHVSRLGQALGQAAERAKSVTPAGPPESKPESAGRPNGDIQSDPPPTAAQVVLISDLQRGVDLETFRPGTWPAGVSLDVRHVRPAVGPNGSFHFMPPDDKPANEPRRSVAVRVSHFDDPATSGSQPGTYRLSWQSDTDDNTSEAEASLESSSTIQPGPDDVTIQVPPGQSRIVRVPHPSDRQNELILSGDRQDFDNTRYFVLPPQRRLRLRTLGPSTTNGTTTNGTTANQRRDGQPTDASNVRPSEDARQNPLYYLTKVPLGDSRFAVEVAPVTDDDPLPDDPSTTPLVVVTSPVTPEEAESLRSYAEVGGKVLVVLTADQADDPDAAWSDTLTRLSPEAPLSVGPRRQTDALLADIDFTDPLFAPMAQPQYSDFTKIQFWSHQQLTPPDQPWRTIARFDDDDPAICVRNIGQGQLSVLAAGWHPDESQLALSSKFIPLLSGWFWGGAGRPVSMPTRRIGQPFSENVDRPPDQPGIYTVVDGNQPQNIALNMDPRESETTPIEIDELERLGITLGPIAEQSARVETMRQLRDRELESRQRLWQWLLVAALGVLALESAIASRSRRSPAPAT